MTLLQVMAADDGWTVLRESVDGKMIADELAQRGIRFERWTSQAVVTSTSTDDEVITGYEPDVVRLRAECGQPNVVVERIEPHEGSPQLREKFLNEHFHEEDEIWFFVDGCSCFSLHVDDLVYVIVCERGDLLSIPAGTRHWFDMGATPHFCAVRFYRNPDSAFRAEFTGDPIPQRFPSLMDTVLSAR
jgi:1,2-dihydroxy-3-keto-5-methylthiopentene dioxygenase